MGISLTMYSNDEGTPSLNKEYAHHVYRDYMIRFKDEQQSLAHINK